MLQAPVTSPVYQAAPASAGAMTLMNGRQKLALLIAGFPYSLGVTMRTSQTEMLLHTLRQTAQICYAALP